MSFFEDESEVAKSNNKTNKVEVVLDEVSNEELTSQLVAVENNKIKMDTFSKIKEIDRLYKQGIIQYTESIHRYNIEIEKLKNTIELESSKNIKEEKALFAVENILEYECRLFESTHHKFTQKLESFVELRDEYKESLEEGIYKEKLSRKEQEIFTLIDEIEEKEILLLKQELEKINLSNELSKKMKREEELRVSLKELELEKAYFESTGLNQISGFKLEDKSIVSIPETVVDTVIMEEEK